MGRRPEYKWDLLKDGITQSALTLWMECREQFYLRYVEGWTSRASSLPLNFGIMFHALLAEIKGNVDTKKDRVKKASDKISKQRGLRLGLKQGFLNTLGMVDVVLDAYYKFWQKRDAKRKWTFHEKRFRVPYAAHTPYADPIYFRGMWDSGYLSYRQPCLHEVKTKGRIDESGLQATLQFDFQSMFYACAFWKQEGRAPRRILYDVIRRPQLRQGKSEEHEDYLQRIRVDIVDRPAWYFMRWETEVKLTSLAYWEKHVLRGLMESFLAWHYDVSTSQTRWDASTHFMNPNALFTKMGGRSDFFDLITRDSTYNLYKRAVPFPELEG